MRNKNGTKRITVSKTFSFPSDTAEFIRKRGQDNESLYIKRLVEYDRAHNTLAEAMKEEIEQLAPAA